MDERRHEWLERGKSVAVFAVVIAVVSEVAVGLDTLSPPQNDLTQTAAGGVLARHGKGFHVPAKPIASEKQKKCLEFRNKAAEVSNGRGAAAIFPDELIEQPINEGQQRNKCVWALPKIERQTLGARNGRPFTAEDFNCVGGESVISNKNRERKVRSIINKENSKFGTCCVEVRDVRDRPVGPRGKVCVDGEESFDQIPGAIEAAANTLGDSITDRLEKGVPREDLEKEMFEHGTYRDQRDELNRILNESQRTDAGGNTDFSARRQTRGTESSFGDRIAEIAAGDISSAKDVSAQTASDELRSIPYVSSDAIRLNFDDELTDFVPDNDGYQPISQNSFSDSGPTPKYEIVDTAKPSFFQNLISRIAGWWPF